MMVGMEDVSSECSSGCQSGWTMYLDQSSYSNQNHAMETHGGEEEEDLSMLSDASSGPSPLFHDEIDLHESHNLFYAKDWSKKSSVQTGKQRKLSPASYLDDTASSPFYDHKFNNGAMNPALHTMVDFSSSFSTTQFKVINFLAHNMTLFLYLIFNNEINILSFLFRRNLYSTAAYAISKHLQLLNQSHKDQ